MFNLKGKSAVITGGGSGIGRAIALLFAKQGAKVYILEFNEQSAQQTAEEINQFGEAYAFSCDVSNQDQVLDAFNRMDKVDILVNNAGIAHIGNLEKTAEADFERVYQVNVKGVYNCLYAAIPLMKKIGGGVILNMASIASVVGVADRFAYSMSKGAIYAMSMSVARDFMVDGIRSNSISPARVHTPFVDGFITKNYPDNQKEIFQKLSKSQPIGRMAKPEEVATLALYLCSEEAGFITGNDYPIDGGFIKLNN
ncbi:SDR family oxidoreductase [Albibacterium sp.]|uniref:SDR family NAD(P)-dependent oxidoreductase n=1 Tax=Albibacterium sp. TaxID=2952885 RepID=UPI002D1A1E21|nr:SDR family oxidoreductase [Albibacterium sp.]HUH19450.1 SDR family oxidoreductase [Albibacterium sp.]